jgi:hypothetical protein
MFTSYVKNKDSHDTIIFGGGNQCNVKGLGKIDITTEHSISNVFLVKSLGYKLLYVSQLCHMDYNSLCTNIDISVFRRSDGSLALVVIPEYGAFGCLCFFTCGRFPSLS